MWRAPGCAWRSLPPKTRPTSSPRAIADYDMLFAKQLAAGRLTEARQTLDSIVRLCGLAAPQRIELYDFSSYSDEQLAQRGGT